MKRLLMLLMIVVVSKISAQQKPYYTQYILNNYILNPALTGIENYTDIKLSYRNQWTGIDGSPVTVYLSAHTPLGKKDYRTTATSIIVSYSNPYFINVTYPVIGLRPLPGSII